MVQDAFWFSQQSEKVRNTLMAGVIQNFEIAYELCAKMPRRRLEMDALNPSEVDFANFKDVLRLAAGKRTDPRSARLVWLPPDAQHHGAHLRSPHSQAGVRRHPRFLLDACQLLRHLEGLHD